MNTALAWKGLNHPSQKLSVEGRELVADLKDVIQKAKVLFLTKNQGNLLQDFTWQCQHIGSGDASTPTAPVDKETAKQHGQEALEGFRTLGTLLITNGQFRKLREYHHKTMTTLYLNHVLIHAYSQRCFSSASRHCGRCGSQGC